ncbi:hypothetical protein ABWL39_14965 [Chitinivorax sp. PXF-14]|uniref:hypothetical protein n=1 Tax=Chitinivorax sp. PXF-14 TaxID=3230488 RepID=UPI003464EFA4
MTTRTPLVPAGQQGTMLKLLAAAMIAMLLVIPSGIHWIVQHHRPVVAGTAGQPVAAQPILTNIALARDIVRQQIVSLDGGDTATQRRQAKALFDAAMAMLPAGTKADRELGAIVDRANHGFDMLSIAKPQIRQAGAAELLQALDDAEQYFQRQAAR